MQHRVTLGLLAGAILSACAPALAQQEQPRLSPPAGYERDYQAVCRDRPSACAGGYGSARDEVLTRRQDEAMDTIRRREQDAQQQLQQQQQPR